MVEQIIARHPGLGLLTAVDEFMSVGAPAIGSAAGGSSHAG